MKQKCLQIRVCLRGGIIVSVSGLTIERTRVRFSPVPLHVTTLDKLFTARALLRVTLCHQAVILVLAQVR